MRQSMIDATKHQSEHKCALNIFMSSEKRRVFKLKNPGELIISVFCVDIQAGVETVEEKGKLASMPLHGSGHTIGSAQYNHILIRKYFN